MGEYGKIVEVADELAEPVKIGVEAYVSADYARDEQDKLWRKTWLQAGRLVGVTVAVDLLQILEQAGVRLAAIEVRDLPVARAGAFVDRRAEEGGATEDEEVHVQLNRRARVGLQSMRRWAIQCWGLRDFAMKFRRVSGIGVRVAS